MVHTCVVSGCRNRRTPGTALSFYRFPRDPERKQRWVDAVNREGWQPNDGSRLCSTHFISGMMTALVGVGGCGVPMNKQIVVVSIG